VKWEDVLADGLARKQRAWERRCAVVRAVRSGASQGSIAKNMGVTRGMVWSLYQSGLWYEKHRPIAPLELYLSSPEPVDDFLAKRLVRALRQKRPGDGQGA
jgi:hypothetical protein